jgi:RNA polymerase-binding transcription factor DksA
MKIKPAQTVDKIRQLLLRQQKKVEEEIKSIEQDDPVLNESLPESSEPGTDSWMADVHGRAVAAKQSLQDVLTSIKKSLTALKLGKYGKCENCGKQIEAARLAVMPTATLCIACSKKKAKGRG